VRWRFVRHHNLARRPYIWNNRQTVDFSALISVMRDRRRIYHMKIGLFEANGGRRVIRRPPLHRSIT